MDYPLLGRHVLACCDVVRVSNARQGQSGRIKVLRIPWTGLRGMALCGHPQQAGRHDRDVVGQGDEGDRAFRAPLPLRPYHYAIESGMVFYQGLHYIFEIGRYVPYQNCATMFKTAGTACAMGIPAACHAGMEPLRDDGANDENMAEAEADGSSHHCLDESGYTVHWTRHSSEE